MTEESNLYIQLITLQKMAIITYKYWVEESFLPNRLLVTFSIIPRLFVSKINNQSNFKLYDFLKQYFIFINLLHK